MTILGHVGSCSYSRHLPHVCQQPLETTRQKLEFGMYFWSTNSGRPEDDRCYVDGKALDQRSQQTQRLLPELVG